MLSSAIADQSVYRLLLEGAHKHPDSDKTPCDDEFKHLLRSIVPSASVPAPSEARNSDHLGRLYHHRTASSFRNYMCALNIANVPISSEIPLFAKCVQTSSQSIEPCQEDSSAKFLLPSPQMGHESVQVLERRGSSGTSGGEAAGSLLKWLKDDGLSTAEFPINPLFNPDYLGELSSSSRSRLSSPSESSPAPHESESPSDRRVKYRGSHAPTSGPSLKEPRIKYPERAKDRIETVVDSKLGPRSSRRKQQQSKNLQGHLKGQSLTREQVSANKKRAVAARNAQYSSEQLAKWGKQGSDIKRKQLEGMSTQERADRMTGASVTNARYSRETRSAWAKRGQQRRRENMRLQGKKDTRGLRRYKSEYKQQLAERAKRGAMATNARYSREQRSQWAKDGALKRWRMAREQPELPNSPADQRAHSESTKRLKGERRQK